MMRRAKGWLELRAPLEANEELEEIQPVNRTHPEVLKLRFAVFSAAGKWDMALEIAGCLHRELPEDSFGGIHVGIAAAGQ